MKSQSNSETPMKGQSALSRTPEQLIALIDNAKTGSLLNEFYQSIGENLSLFTAKQLVELLDSYTKANLYNINFLDQWSTAFYKNKDKTISMVVSTIKNFAGLKYNSNQKILKNFQSIISNQLAYFKTEQLIEVFQSFAKLQPFKEIIKLPSERLDEIKEFVAKIVERINVDFDNHKFSASDLSKVIFALAKLEFKDDNLNNKWAEIALEKIDEFESYDLVKSIESLVLLDFYHSDLFLQLINRSQNLLQLNAFSTEQKIIESFYLAMLFVNNKTLLNEASISQTLIDHVARLLYYIDTNSINKISEQREVIFALDALDLLNAKPGLENKFTLELIEKWLQVINSNIHNEVTITESQKNLISSLRKIQASGLDIDFEIEKTIIRSLGPVDIVVYFNYAEGSLPLIIQDDGLPHYRLSNFEEINSKTKANTNILRESGINFIRVNSYLENHREIFTKIIEKFPTIALDKNEPVIPTIIEAAHSEKSIVKTIKNLPSKSTIIKQKRSSLEDESFDEIIAKFKNENLALYNEQKNLEDQSEFLTLLNHSPKKYLFRAIEKQDYKLIEASIKHFKKEKHSIKESKEIGELIYKQLINTSELAKEFDQQKIQQIEDSTMYETYQLVYNEENIPLNDPEIAAKIKINGLLLKSLWFEFEQYIKDKTSNNVIVPTLSYAVFARNNELLVRIIDIMVNHNVGKKESEILKSLITPILPNAIIYNNFAALQYMLNKIKVDVNHETKNKGTLLYDSSYMLNSDAVNYLLNEMNAQPNILSYHSEIGNVPPIYGAVLGYIHKFDPNMGSEDLSHLPPFKDTVAETIVKYLLEAGANTNFEANNVHFIFTAIQYNAVSIVKHAIDKGEIDMNAIYESFGGVRGTPKGFAEHLKRSEILALLSPKKQPTEEENKEDANSVETLTTKKKYFEDEDEEQPNSNQQNCIVCTSLTEETINPELYDLFTRMFEKPDLKNLNANQLLNFDIFGNPIQKSIKSVEIQNIPQKINFNIGHNEWLNDPEINKLLLAIGPMNHQKINRLIKEKGGQPIKAIKYFYDLPDGGRGEYIENFSSKEKYISSGPSTYFDELKTILDNLEFNPLEPIYIDPAVGILASSSDTARDTSFLIFDENGFRIATELEQAEFNTEPAVLDDINVIENNFHPDLFEEPAPVENIAIANEWLYINVLPLCLFMFMGMQSQIHILE